MLNNTYFSIYQDFDDYKLEQRLLSFVQCSKSPFISVTIVINFQIRVAVRNILYFDEYSINDIARKKLFI